ncbi:hypothetical protein EK21DRAFT_92612 [Setomelanomma holmii]|uniref:Uncharacterized protein n=1 Tax=Setomelanomma holmii TaxID=210430 RepID=A0A9P4H1K2_9PLEO|nr:hypothetical protein EK21DRAFT_92612 [Setomelanomma holmii]
MAAEMSSPDETTLLRRLGLSQTSYLSGTIWNFANANVKSLAKDVAEIANTVPPEVVSAQTTAEQQAPARRFTPDLSVVNQPLAMLDLGDNPMKNTEVADVTVVKLKGATAQEVLSLLRHTEFPTSPSQDETGRADVPTMSIDVTDPEDQVQNDDESTSNQIVALRRVAPTLSSATFEVNEHLTTGLEDIMSRAETGSPKGPDAAACMSSASGVATNDSSQAIDKPTTSTLTSDKVLKTPPVTRPAMKPEDHHNLPRDLGLPHMKARPAAPSMLASPEAIKAYSQSMASQCGLLIPTTRRNNGPHGTYDR